MSNLSKFVEERFMLMVMAGLVALVGKAFSYGNTQEQYDNFCNSVENFYKSFNKELDQ